jgi:hypothetical protein
MSPNVDRQLHSRILRASLLGVLAFAQGARVSAQTGGPYDLTRSTIDGGGATFTGGGIYGLGGTIGQVDAGASSAGVFVLRGGFWPTGLEGELATPTVTGSQTPTLAQTGTPSPTATPTETATPTGSVTPSPPVVATVTGTVPTPMSTLTPTSPGSPGPSVTATPTLTKETCGGDCGHDGNVAISDLVLVVNVAVGKAQVTECDAGDGDQDGTITIDEVIVAVNHALNGCG